MMRTKNPGYRPLKEFEEVRPDDWFDAGGGGLRIMNGRGYIPDFARRVISVPRWLVGSFWRNILNEGRRLGCDHPQNPDDTIPGPWLKDLPCPVPTCSAGQHGGIWHVEMPPPRVSLAMALNGGPLGEYRRITYVSEPVSIQHGRGPEKKYYRWRLER